MEQDEVRYSRTIESQTGRQTSRTIKSQTERQNRPFQYQVYEMTEKTVSMEMSVKSITNIPFNFWRKGKLNIVIKDLDGIRDDGIFTTLLLGSSTCEEKINWVYRRDQKLHLVLSLEYTDEQWHVHHVTTEINISKFPKVVTFKMIQKTAIDRDSQVSKWAFVLFDVSGNTAKVRSSSLFPSPKRNAIVDLVIGTKSFTVVVIEVAETEEALDIFEAEWEKSSEAIQVAKSKIKLPKGQNQWSSFIGLRTYYSKWVLVLFDIDGNTDKVKSTQLLQAPKKNIIVDLVIGSESFAVLVLEVAETDTGLDRFKNEWQKPSSLDSYTDKSEGGNIFPSSFLRYKELVAYGWALVLFDTDGSTEICESKYLGQTPKKNAIVGSWRLTGQLTPVKCTVVVLEVADTVEGIKSLKKEWKKTNEAMHIATLKKATDRDNQTMSFIDYREKISPWVLVLFDIEGNTNKVRSTNLLQSPKKNTTVDLKVGHELFAVVVLEVAETEGDLDKFKNKWQKPSSLDSFTPKSDSGNKFPSSFLRYRELASQFALVLFDIGGNTAIVKSTSLLQTPHKNAIVDLDSVTELLTVIVLELADNEKQLTTFEEEWQKTSEAIHIAKIKNKTDSTNHQISFIDYREMLSKWVFILFDIDGNTDTVRSTNLSQAPKKNIIVDLVIGSKSFAVLVLDVAETEKELDIFKKEWQQTSYRACYIDNLKARNYLPSSMLRDRSPTDGFEVAKFKISLKTTEQDVKCQSSPCLCESEDMFVKNRRNKVYDALKKKDKNTKKENVPAIAIIGSGGGMRAVIGMGAALDQLEQDGLLDCAMYTAGLSGSAWYLLTLYADANMKLEQKEGNLERKELKLQPAMVNQDVQTKLQNKFTIYSWMAFKVFTYYIRSITYNHGEYFTFTNLFGEMIGGLLLPKGSKQKWSDLAEPLEKGLNPLPLVSALYVRDEETLVNYNEWLEFSPFQVFLPRYGAAIEMKQFGDKFYRGCCTQKYDEHPIHFLQGICGSAYAIVRDYRPQGNEWYVEDRRFMKNSGIWLLFNKFDSAFVAKVPNFLHGISEKRKIAIHPEPYMWYPFHQDDMYIHMNKSRGYLGSREVTRYKFWSKLNDSIWSFFKEFVRVALDMIAVNFGYEPRFRAVSEEYKQRMMLVDAGIAFNSPYPSVLHPSRNVDIIISFDFSDRGEDAALPFEELKKAEKWARARGVPFPELYPKLHTIEDKWIEGDHKEVYVFPGSDSPTIIHFVMLNKSFRLKNDSISANFDAILEKITMNCLLEKLRICEVISKDEQHRIEKHLTQDKRNALLEIMIKRRKPAVNALINYLNKIQCTTFADTLMSDPHNIQNEGANSFDILPDYGTLRFSYSKKEFDKLNELIRHNVKQNVGEIIKCIEEKNIEKETAKTEEKEIMPTMFKEEQEHFI